VTAPAPLRLRFAPSPTGPLHVGNARTALFNWLLARSAGGTFVLRIEDTDAVRSSAEAEAAILDDLRWLGLAWDEGPDIGGPYGPYRQSERLAIYRQHAERLVEAGLAYPCFCSADQIEKERQMALAAGRPPRYRGTCRRLPASEVRARLAAGEPAAIRFAVPAVSEVAFTDLVRGRVVFSTEVIGDPVILRSDGRPAYNFAVVVDDALMRITHVVRGEDHVSNTPRQVLLYRALGLTPPAFAHVALVMGRDHTPLSKRHGATSVAEFRARGYLPEALVNYLALIGWSAGGDEEILPVEELARRFAIEQVGRSPGVFDEGKLAWMNRQYLRRARPERLAELVRPFFEQAGFARQPDAEGLAYLASLLPMIASAVDRLDQAPQRVAFLFAFDAARLLSRADVGGELAEPGAREVVRAFAEEAACAPRLLHREAFRALAARVGQRTGRKGRALFHPIRVALTGEPEGPELDLAVPAIDRGAELPATAGIGPILGCRERAAAVVRLLA
jgi:glutamyl-tRNA synthetase